MGILLELCFRPGRLAENSTFIEVPKELSSRNINIFEIQITELVEEGTVVQQG